MRVLVLYFSGTGNTDYVARYLADRIVHVPVEIQMRSMEQQPAEDVPDFDVLAVGFPVYGADSPRILQDYLARLAPGEGRGALAFGTKGAWAGGAVVRTLGRLAERGYVPLGGGSVLMPGTDGLALTGKDSWMARWALGKDYDHLKDADRLAQRMAGVLSGLVAGEPAEASRQGVRRGPAGSLSDRVWAYLYDGLAEGYAAGRLRADERCNGCGLCARLCPTGNIELVEGRPRFAGRCTPCMRCVHLCPQEAVQIGRLTVNKFRWRGPKGTFKPLRWRPKVE